jgi:acyl carrier protein
MTRKDVSQTVKLVMIRVLDLDLAPADIGEQVPLYSAAIRLDSLALLQIITELEKAFACQIDDEAVMMADLIDVGSLIQLVESQLAP